MPKFKKTVEELITDTDKWLYFMKNARSLETIPHKLQDCPNFVEAFHVVEKALWTRKELDLYTANENQIGKERRQQDIVREELIINSFENGLNIDLIAKITGISLEEIKEIRNKIRK